MLHQPIVTVVIATRNRVGILEECLRSLTKQTASENNFHVLIVDNNSTDSTQGLLQKYVEKYNNFSCVFEEKIGLSSARNRGILESATEWVAFLDDDARAHPNWIERMLEVIKMDVFDCFGGVYLAWFKYGQPPGWFGDEWGTNKSCVKNHFGLLPDGQYPSGGNAVYKRAIVIAHNGFSLNFGVSGSMKNPAYGEETDLINRMRKQGARVGFVPDMIIDHCVMPHKYKLKWHMASKFASSRDYTKLSMDITLISNTKYLLLILRIIKLSAMTILFPLYLEYQFLKDKKNSGIKKLLVKAILQLCSHAGGISGYFYNLRA